MPTLQRTGKEIVRIYDRHVDSVYRLCFSFMKNPADAEDMVQETFLRLMSSGKQFESEEHEKAWLIVTASNLCKDALKKWWRKNENIDDYAATLQSDDIPDNSVVQAILDLPAKYKTVVYLYYYEGYATAEIARYLRCREATVRSRLSRARKQLHSMLGGDLQ
ncbi:MAG: RNA polymerase sigma factor [Oscillospiraceae bacterium]|nr:RNA polymerase sigma factor [Oscillospiraceae bacterium]